MNIDESSTDRSRRPWSALLWLLPALVLLGVALLGAAPGSKVGSADAPAVPGSQSPSEIDHSAVDWSTYPVEPAQPEQSVAAYDRD